MTRNVEMEISLWELILSIKRWWKVIVLAGIICALLGGAAGYISESSQLKRQDESMIAEQEQKKEWFIDNQKMYEESGEVCEDALIKMREMWLRLAKMQKQHPLMQVDPYQCEWENITLRFDSDSGYHYGTVFNWLQDAESAKVFGDAVDDLEEYKNDLILIDDRECETTVLVVKVPGFDIEPASAYLLDLLQQEAKNSGVNVTSVTSKHVTGYLYRVADFIKYTRDTMNTVQGTMNNVMNVTSAFPQPQEPETLITSISKRAILKSAIMGFLLGLIAGAAFMMVLTMKQGRVISRRQIEDTFDLEQLGDCSREHSAFVDVLNANLDVMTGVNSRIMILPTVKDEKISDIATKLNEQQEREFIAGKDIADDSETIDALYDAVGIVIAVQIGKSRIADIQRILLRARRLDKKVLGFIRI